MEFKHTPVAVAWLILLTTTAQAQVNPQPYTTENGLEITPELTLGYRYDDNIALATEPADEESSDIVELGVSLDFIAARGLSTYSAVYDISGADYLDSDIDDYVDQGISLQADLDLAYRHGVVIDGEYNDQHEARGSDLTEENGYTELLYYKTRDLKALYAFGGDASTARIESYIGWGDNVYSNGGFLTQDADWEEFRYGATFYYNISLDTNLFLELSRSERRYDNGDTGSDNNDNYAYLGASWNLTGKTTGTAKIGYEYKDYKLSGIDDYKGISWDLSLIYNPVARSTITVSTSNLAEETSSYDSYMDEVIYTVEWEHYWLDRLFTEVSYSNTNDDYASFSREDETNARSIIVGYDLRRWLEVSFGYTVTDKDSTDSDIGYEQHEYYLTLTGTL